MKNSSWIRVVSVVLLGASLAACGGGRKGTTAVGVGIGVSLSAPSGTSVVLQGGTIEIDATVSNDVNAAGVTWTLSGPTCPGGAQCGSIASSSKTKAVYQAPSGIVGAITATLTATSVADTTKAASVTLTINGTPTIAQPILFPANVNVLYATYISVAGGTSPYTWKITTGALPAGLSLSTSTTATESITGTPSAQGSSSFTLQVTDTAGKTASVDLTLVVKPQSACLLLGRFAYLFTGFRSGMPVTRAGSFNVAADGTVTGVYDYKDADGGRVAEAVTSGTCKTSTQNRGTLQLVSAAGSESFDYATDSTLAAGQLQENDGTGIVGSGIFSQQTAAAFTPATLAGDHVFGLVGDNGAHRRLAVVGRVTADAAGVISGGLADTDAATPVAGGALTGTFGAPDANGRGTVTFAVGGQSLPLAYYIVDASQIFLASADTSGTAPRLAGRMTPQTGAGTLDATAFAAPAVLSMWGTASSGGVPAASMSAGLLSGAAPAAGTVSLVLDVADRGLTLVNTKYPGSAYTVAPTGRGTLAIGTGAAARSFVLYADGAGGGYLLEPVSAVGNFGILEKQTGAPFGDFATAYYVGGTLFPGSTSPITLAPQMLFQNGAISGNVTGSYALDPASGRLIATVSRNIFGGSGLVIYIVSADKLVVLGDSVNSANSALAWLQHY